jgi:hypothetical protein
VYIPILQGTLWGLLERWPDLVLRHMNRLDLAQAGLPIKNPPKKPTQNSPRKKTHVKKPIKNGFFGLFLGSLSF